MYTILVLDDYSCIRDLLKEELGSEVQDFDCRRSIVWSRSGGIFGAGFGDSRLVPGKARQVGHPDRH